MVVVVDAGLAAVEVWGWDPFGAVVGSVFSGGPAGFGVVDEAVVAAAGEGEFGDVGAAAVLPVGVGVVELPQVLFLVGCEGRGWLARGV